jgi:flagellar biosynthetic protein FliR
MIPAGLENVEQQLLIWMLAMIRPGAAFLADPASGQASPAVGQFLSMLAMFLFLAADGHLALVAIIAESYQALPPGQSWISYSAIGGIAKFGGLAFSAGLSIALPVGFALILVQIIMAMIARSAPTLNLFAVGMPAALLAGVILLGMATPVMADTISHTIHMVLDQAQLLGGGGG